MSEASPSRATIRGAKRSAMSENCASRNFLLLSSIVLGGLYLLAPSLMAQDQAPAVQVPTPVQAGQSTDVEAPQALHLLVGRSLVITSPSRIKRVSIADPNIAEAIVVSPTQVLVNGKVPGGVLLLIWD